MLGLRKDRPRSNRLSRQRLFLLFGEGPREQTMPSAFSQVQPLWFAWARSSVLPDAGIAAAVFHGGSAVHALRHLGPLKLRDTSAGTQETGRPVTAAGLCCASSSPDSLAASTAAAAGLCCAASAADSFAGSGIAAASLSCASGAGGGFAGSGSFPLHKVLAPKTAGDLCGPVREGCFEGATASFGSCFS